MSYKRIIPRFPDGGKLSNIDKTLPIYYGPSKHPCNTPEGCSGWSTTRIANLYGINRESLSPEDAWYRRASVLNSGGKEIWNENNPTKLNYHDVQSGDMVMMGGSYTYRGDNISKTGLPLSDNFGNSHTGHIIGRAQETNYPLVEHKFGREVRIDTLNQRGLEKLGVSSIVRPKAIENKIPLQANGFIPYGEDIPLNLKIESTPDVIKNSNFYFGDFDDGWKNKINNYVEALDSNKQKVGQTTGLSPKEMEVLSGIALGIYGNESTFDTNLTRGIKQGIKQVGHSIGLGGRFSSDPSIGPTRLKFDDAIRNADGTITNIGKTFNNLGITKSTIKRTNSNALSTLAVLAENYKRLKNDKSYNKETGTIWDGVPIEHAVIDSWKNRFPSNQRKETLRALDSDYVKSALNSMRLLDNDTIFPRALQEVVVKPNYAMGGKIDCGCNHKKRKFQYGGDISTLLDKFYTGGNKLPKYNMGGALSGAATGASLGSMVMPGIGTAVGAIGGALVGYLGGKNQEDKQREARQKTIDANRRQQEELLAINDQAILGQHNSYGTPNISYYPDGGTIDLMEGADYEVEGGEVVQGGAVLESSNSLSSDLDLAVGPSHDGGGVLGAGGERVFSDRGKVDKSIVDLLSELGIGKVKGKTYGEVAENLGKKKGKMEEKLMSPFTPSNKTAEKTLPRIDAALDILFESQEAEKEGDSNMTKFAKGGKIKPYRRIDALPDGGTLYKRPNINTLPQTVGVTTIEPTFNTPETLPKVDITTSFKPDISGIEFNPNFDWGSVLGHVGNLGNYMSNRQSIRDLNTNVNRNLMPAPTYSYTDRSGAERNAVGRMIRTGQQALGTSSRTVNAANQAALMAQGLEANNRISQAENQRRDRYDMYYNDQAMRTNMANIGITNQASDMRRELENRKNVYLPQQARTSFMQGVMGNEAMRQQRSSDGDRLRISALLNDNNGVLSRAAEKLGFSSVDEYINHLLNR